MYAYVFIHMIIHFYIHIFLYFYIRLSLYLVASLMPPTHILLLCVFYCCVVFAAVWFLQYGFCCRMVFAVVCFLMLCGLCYCVVFVAVWLLLLCVSCCCVVFAAGWFVFLNPNNYFLYILRKYEFVPDVVARASLLMLHSTARPKKHWSIVALTSKVSQVR